MTSLFQAPPGVSMIDLLPQSLLSRPLTHPDLRERGAKRGHGDFLTYG
jgi:hypothetical protein